MFDGVHLGHREILSAQKEIAQNIGGETALLTFDPHPRKALQKDEDLFFLSPLEEKAQKLESLGLDNLIVQPFDKAFSEITPEEFVEKVLFEKLHLHTLIIGHDHRFGKGRAGDFDLLQKYSTKLGFSLLQIEAIQKRQKVVSSSKIRTALLGGDLDFANHSLGDFYSLQGKVIEGKKIGQTLGFPTANLQMHPQKLIPKKGVYAVWVKLDGKKIKGVMNIGSNPTVSQERSNSLSVEVHLLDFSSDLYDKTLEVSLVSYLREEHKFFSLLELKEQIAKDIELAKDILD
ncbi:MAG: riboflavin biosynthesis protein RibF [Flavobacteriaceae bacterium]|nr:MAG: riboflavin biosynthesis protein RibF [Flavobacteriaceae bacterium]